MGLRYTSENSQDIDDMLMWMGSYAVAGDYREILTTNTRNRKISAVGYGSTSQADLIGIQITVSVYFASSSGTIKLNSQDPLSFPKVTLNLLDTEEDVQKMSHGVKLAHSIMKSEELSGIVKDVLTPSDDLFQDDDLFVSWLRQNTTTGNHLTSSCSMGSQNNPMAVVDENCKTHGINNLFIADASVMPNTVRANTNVTTMMIGEKLSSFLKQSN